MPYKDKNKKKEADKAYAKKNQALLNLKRKRRRQGMAQSFEGNGSVLDSTPAQSPVPPHPEVLKAEAGKKSVLDELREKISNLEKSKQLVDCVSKIEIDPFKGNYETVYD